MKRERGVGTRGRGRNWRLALAAAAGVTPIVAGLLPAWGVTKTFSASGTDWSVPANWTPRACRRRDDALISRLGRHQPHCDQRFRRLDHLQQPRPIARWERHQREQEFLLTLSSGERRR